MIRSSRSRELAAVTLFLGALAFAAGTAAQTSNATLQGTITDQQRLCSSRRDRQTANRLPRG